ncbi:PBSX family phage terminase large subunit [Acetobacterium wieringae]|uniref:PBSX family phage terminase large subunit n=1 Tax=Acetobacterium wieringae TaxID=52694 RepID=UPI002B205634|nr:PBSX family phage terminase large subunit [Acetobacterium wieringae]MEA4804780.1 PBSX family phage terminase large subunit [Acetobacterium wieringae]
MNSKTDVYLPEKIGKGYKTFWNFKGRYRVVKGGRGSKKSTTAAQWIIYNMMKYPLANALIVRRVFNTHKDSTWTQLKWATHNLNVSHLWYFSKSPLEATFKPTGQKILFRGLDDPMGITSITVEKGYLCWCWFEEAFQVMDEDAFNKVDLSIRGELPAGYFKQITLTLNPWSEKHWIKKRFFDHPGPDILAMTTSYQCNEFLGDDDRQIFETMKQRNPRRYSIEGLGEWGIAEGLVYQNFQEMAFDKDEISRKPSVTAYFGLDFGYTNDPTAFIALLVDKETKSIFIYDEIYKKALTNKDIFNEISYRGYAKEKIIADGAEPKSIEELRRLGLRRIRAARKGPDSIMFGIQKLQDYQIFVHPNCENTLVEFNNYIWDNKNGQIINKPVDDYNHLLDSLRYATENIGRQSGITVLK